MGRLKRAPIIMPCSHHFIFKILIPMVNPIRVRAMIVDTAKYQVVGPPDADNIQQINPDSMPKIVAIINRFVLSIVPPRTKDMENAMRVNEMEVISISWSLPLEHLCSSILNVPHHDAAVCRGRWIVLTLP